MRDLLAGFGSAVDEWAEDLGATACSGKAARSSLNPHPATALERTR